MNSLANNGTRSWVVVSRGVERYVSSLAAAPTRCGFTVGTHNRQRHSSHSKRKCASSHRPREMGTYTKREQSVRRLFFGFKEDD